MSASMVGGLAGGFNRHSSGVNANFCRRTKSWSTIPGRSAACARIARWRSIETRSSGPRRARRGWRPLVGSPKRERRGFAMTPRGKHSPGSPSSCACNTPRRPNPTSRTRCYCFWSIPLSLSREREGPPRYSTRCLVTAYQEILARRPGGPACGRPVVSHAGGHRLYDRRAGRPLYVRVSISAAEWAARAFRVFALPLFWVRVEIRVRASAGP